MLHPQSGYTESCQSSTGLGKARRRDRRSNHYATPPFFYTWPRPSVPTISLPPSFICNKKIQVRSRSKPSSWYRRLFLLTNPFSLLAITLQPTI